MTRIKQGMDLPILGSPEQHIETTKPASKVALLGDDYVGMRPTMLVAEGDRVSTGQPLFEDKKNPGVIFTSPASGQVAAVNRGAKRRFESIEINVEGDDRVEFAGAKGADPSALGREGVTSQLVQSGLWTSLRTRPFGKVPSPGSQPSSIFVQAIDTNPLAADPVVAMGQKTAEFTLGLRALT
ncbi:MAG: NADH:ubiquinone reductase (Na(+)-transporting) subunit A, partial [Rubripirellula sp.]|nr:NADH:ubiquinone reductase (Na(+)-transporting) subunit A [Rubripirellula sp.]